ncbi:MAG TPA: hypothetical protein PK808_02845 [Polymorphobacter sp.]|nr:hypothetical protein [Polymorphobacter sp.]
MFAYVELPKVNRPPAVPEFAPDPVVTFVLPVAERVKVTSPVPAYDARLASGTAAFWSKLTLDAFCDEDEEQLLFEQLTEEVMAFELKLTPGVAMVPASDTSA